ncbi:hypothetical protein V493_03704 [Pseudogymnoascus sp. VKM F-4281 (FW-2241)]|nr:hypothetical protein V493_03704 [Pseudogymnoascus sp. VKM F-4281 (FW-2241)]
MSSPTKSASTALLKYILNTYALTAFDTLTAAGYVDFADTAEDYRWRTIRGECTYLARRDMDRLWVRVVMEGWMRMEWCWEGGDVEGVVIALLEREDGAGVEEMWEERRNECPGMDISLCYPIVGHNGIFEDYRDLAIRAVINPEICCYLEKMEDGEDYAERELEESVSNIGIAGVSTDDDTEDVVIKEETGTGSVDKEEAEKEVEIKKEDDDSENILYGIEEAIPDSHLTGSLNKDAGDKEAASTNGEEGITTKKDTKKEKDATEIATHTIRAAISNLHLTELVQNSSSGTSSTTGDSESSTASSSAPNGLGNATSPPALNTPASNKATMAPMDGRDNPVSGTDGAGDERAVEGTHSTGQNKFTYEESDEMFTIQLALFEDTIRRQHIPVDPNNCSTLRPDWMAEMLTEMRDVGHFGYFTYENGNVSEYIPVVNRLTPKQVSLWHAYNKEFAIHKDDTAFPAGVDVHTMSPMAVATHNANTKAASLSQAENAVYNPASAFQTQPALHSSAPSFQGQTSVHSRSHFSQAQTAVHNPASSFQAHNSVLNQSPFQAQAGVHNSGPSVQAQSSFHGGNSGFRGQTCFHKPESTFQAPTTVYPYTPHSLNNPYPPNGSAYYDGIPARKNFAPNAGPVSNSVNYSATQTTPLYQANPAVTNPGSNAASPANNSATNTAPTIPAVTQSSSQKPLIFYTVTPADMAAMAAVEAQKGQKMYESLSVQKLRRKCTNIKAEENAGIDTEIRHRQSDSIVDRKRARDVDSESEDLGLERPRKLSG